LCELTAIEEKSRVLDEEGNNPLIEIIRLQLTVCFKRLIKIYEVKCLWELK
jgi:hypothetical protein